MRYQASTVEKFRGAKERICASNLSIEERAKSRATRHHDRGETLKSRPDGDLRGCCRYSQRDNSRDRHENGETTYCALGHPNQILIATRFILSLIVRSAVENARKLSKIEGK